MTPARRVLYLGGARSGKSTAAERRLADLPTTYVATARRDPVDAEWQARVQVHRDRRPPHWTTVETQHLAPVIAAATPDRPVLVDCLSLWLTHTLDDLDAWNDPPGTAAAARGAVAELAGAVAACPGVVVLVSNEVGSGVVPATAAGRLFRDLLGMCNAAVAAQCDEVNLVVAGCVVPVKPLGGATL